jgi:hypothetical protein
MNRAMVFAAILPFVAPVVGLAATSSAANQFTLRQDSKRVAEWYEANRAGVMQASNCRIIQELGNGQYKVQTDTPVGPCQYIIRETREQGVAQDGSLRTTYRVTFVRSLSGRLANQTVTISLTGLKGATSVDMRMTTSVSGRLVPVRAVQRVQDGCLAGCERFMTTNLR